MTEYAGFLPSGGFLDMHLLTKSFLRVKRRSWCPSFLTALQFAACGMKLW